MLARLTLILIAIPALALAAASEGPAGGGRLAATTQAAKPAKTLRTANALPRIAPLSPTAQVEPSQCRMGCAQTYYFCRAGDHADDCAPTWGQCVAACNSPALNPGVSTAP